MVAIGPSILLPLSPDEAQNLNPVFPALRLKQVGYHHTKSLKSGNLPSNVLRKIVNLLRASQRTVRGQLLCEKQSMIGSFKDDLSVCKRFFLGVINETQQKRDTVLFIGEIRRLFSKDWILLPQANRVSETHGSESE